MTVNHSTIRRHLLLLRILLCKLRLRLDPASFALHSSSSLRRDFPQVTVVALNLTIRS